jgi:hypothetical protein
LAVELALPQLVENPLAHFRQRPRRRRPDLDDVDDVQPAARRNRLGRPAGLEAPGRGVERGVELAALDPLVVEHQDPVAGVQLRDDLRHPPAVAERRAHRRASSARSAGERPASSRTIASSTCRRSGSIISSACSRQ